MGISGFSNTPPEFDHYTISRVLGEGGMGLVCLANDRRTGLPVAIKVVSGRTADPALLARFLKENRTLSALNDRNIARCHEVTQSVDGIPSIVMEVVEGVDFRAFEGRPFPELLPLMIQALRGLAYLRSQGVLHRDLSSNNILVTLENNARVVKILDFGVAKILQEHAAGGDLKTRTGQFLGKFEFASPEHFSASNIDWRSDVYSLGVVFHRLLTGEPPITVSRTSNYFDWLVAHQKENVFAVVAPAGVPPLPEALRDVVRWMLSRSPDARPQSYEEIIDVLERVQRDVRPDLEPDPLTLQTLPPPVTGKTSSSSSSPPSRASSIARPAPPAAEVESPPAVDASQQKRWPDLDVPESHTERFRALPAPPPPATPASPSPPAEPFPDETQAEPFPIEANTELNPSRTELLPPPASVDETKTGPTVVFERSDRFSEISMWAGGAAKDAQPEPVRPPSPPLEDKTERLDDVIEKLRQKAISEPLPPLKLPSTPEPLPPQPLSIAPPSQPPVGRRLVVYDAPPPSAAQAARRPAPPVPAPAASAPAPHATGRRSRGIGIALIIGAIVFLFAAVLWVLILLLRGASPGDARRSSFTGSSGVVAAAALRSVRPKARMKERP